ncbi:type II toxin-antitoxin system VapC family toxin [Pseudomonas sp. B392_1p]|uniref:type II toxin-antitoxin system VapC family toxin n=1 Tax=Pseudomonas sp. B392_1p TaxID=3457507 RepID=UPI003FD00E9C
MKIAIDTNVLVQIMQNEYAKDLCDPETGEVIDNAFQRAQAFIERVETLKGVVVIPAPVVSEYLLGIEHSHYQAHLDTLNSVKSIEVLPFDQLAAVECAMLVSNQEMKQLDPESKMAKLKYDRQILAIAVAAGAKEIWTHDKQLFNKAKAVGITAKSLAHIEPKPEQYELENV